jgi:hypothetical protein
LRLAVAPPANSTKNFPNFPHKLPTPVAPPGKKLVDPRNTSQQNEEMLYARMFVPTWHGHPAREQN